MKKPLPTPTRDTPTLTELRLVFDRLVPDQRPRWGRMDAAQMVRHCRRFHELCLGRVAVPWWLRRVAALVGPMFLRRLCRRSPRAAPRDLTTLAPLRADPGQRLDFAAERRALFATLDEIAAVVDGHRHPLYGRMRAVDVQTLARHHLAHHANQFGLLDDAAAGATPT